MFAIGRPCFGYVLRCSNESYYVGHTDDLEMRVLEHQVAGKCAYTVTRRPVQLVWSQEIATREGALAAELQIKNWNRAKKQALARGEFEGLSKAARKENWAASVGSACERAPRYAPEKMGLLGTNGMVCFVLRQGARKEQRDHPCVVPRLPFTHHSFPLSCRAALHKPEVAHRRALKALPFDPQH